MLSTLPQELLDYILDYLHDDAPALKSCSTACHAFLLASSYHLFQEVALGRRLRSPTSEVLRHFASTVEASPRLRMHIRGLSLAPPLRVRRSHKDSGLALDLRVLRDALEALPSLHTIDLRYVQIELCDQPVLPLACTHLKKVVLGAVLHPEPSKLRDVLVLLLDVRLDSLEVIGQWTEPQSPIPHEHRSRLQISRLSFDERNPDASGHCLMALGAFVNPNSLLELRIALQNPMTIPHVNDFLRLGFPKMQTLHLDLTECLQSCTDDRMLSSLPAIAGCTSLQNLSLKFSVCSRDASHTAFSASVGSLVTQTLSHARSSVRRVTVTVTSCHSFNHRCNVPEQVGKATTLPLFTLSRVLGSCPALESVVFEVLRESSSAEPLVTEMREAFMRIRSTQGIKYAVSVQ